MKTILHANQAPAAIGPYSQGIDLGDLVFTSGQIPIHPISGSIADDIQTQTRQSLDNVKAVISSAGLSIKDIVKMTLFVKDLNEFDTVNQVYGAFFDEHQVEHYPARSCVEVTRLPKDAAIEIEAIAVRR